MDTLAEFPQAIQYAVRRLANPALTFETLGSERGISKQAVEQQFKKGLAYLKSYTAKEPPEKPVEPCLNCRKLGDLVASLRQQLILAGALAQGLKYFKEKVLKHFPTFKITRLPPLEKKQILDWCDKFKRAGGCVKDFAKHIGRSPETLARWQVAYDKYGLSGLADKSTKPKNFGNRVPLWIKKQLVALFIRYPRWTPYQYHSYIRHNPATNWYISVPVIARLKNMSEEKSESEKERIRKRWCFATGTRAWTIDFTCILKTATYKLQLLTVSDQRSRYLLHADLYLDTSTEIVIRDLEDLFIKYGKPDLIKADNGPEFRIDLRDQLKEAAVYLINSPQYYGQFNGAHERIHRTLKAFLDRFFQHKNLSKLVTQLQEFKDQYNYKMPMDTLGGKTPSDIFYDAAANFMPEGAEIVTPYEKDNELRMKFVARDGGHARISTPIIPKI